MGSIIDRALDIINDHLKDQTSSFPDPISIRPMARGGDVYDDVRSKAKKANVDLDIQRERDRTNLNWIENRSDKKGAAKDIVKSALSVADKIKHPVYLTVMNGEKGLMNYYKSLGFDIHPDDERDIVAGKYLPGGELEGEEPPVMVRDPMARGGHVLEDDYPTHYLPNVGRQVMARGGDPVPPPMPEDAPPPAPMGHNMPPEPMQTVGASMPMEGLHPQLISQRLPTAKKAGEDPNQQALLVGLDAAKQHPKSFEHNVNLVKTYDHMRPGEMEGSHDEVAENFINHLKDNYLFLHDMMPEENRKRAKEWYVGANKFSEDLAARHGADAGASAAAIAAMSPQKDWFQNASLAERLFDIHHKHGDENYAHDMEMTANRIFGKEKFDSLLDELRGKTYNEIEDPRLKAIWARLYDETYHDPAHRLMTPEGAIGDWVTNQDGSRAKVSWGSTNEILKGIKALLQGATRENISGLMGERHKIRNFFNNILAPHSPTQDVTVDTHAVAGGLLEPLGAAATQVSHNFKNNVQDKSPASKGSAETGVQGTYPFYAEALRRAAAERGIEPREMQSITWEGLKGLFPDTFKTEKNIAAVRGIWKDYAAGNIDIDEARNSIVKLAGGMNEPAWSGSAPIADEGAPHSTYERKLSAPRVHGEAAILESRIRGTDSVAIPRLEEQDIRSFQRNRQLTRAARNAFGEAQDGLPQSYTRRTGRVGAGNLDLGFDAPVRAVYDPTDEAKAHFDSAGISAPSMMELGSGPKGARAFFDAINGAKAANKSGAGVDTYPVDEYKKMRLFLTPDGGAGFALKGDDIVSVFNSANSGHKHISNSMLQLAIAQGGRKLDAYDTALPHIYSRNKFVVSSRLPWNDEHKKDEWNYDDFKKYKGGRPDVVFMHYDPSYEKLYDGSEGEYANDYDSAVDAQSRSVKAVQKSMSKPKKKAKAFGGAITPIELGNRDLDDEARRLILWSYAAAPIVRPLSRAEGGPVDDPVDKALNIVGAGTSPASAVETARNLTPMGFYSAASEAASKIPQKAPIDQILNKIKGQPNVKAEELDLSGVRDAFSGQKSVDPKDVAAHLQENLPQIYESVYGYDSKSKRQTNMSPKYERYTFPGGQNYREVVLHDPFAEGSYQSPHWSDPNVIAHLRMADRGMYGLGEPEALHIEEVQSDWGQEGRDAGFREPFKPQSMSQWVKQKYPDRFYDAQRLEQKLSDERFPRLTNDEHELMQEYELSQNEDKSLPPKGPHVTSTESWTDLALKRALMEAAKGKYKKLTWTPGEDQADRYGLDKSYSQIHYSPDTKELFAKGKDGVEDIQERVHPDALHSFIGKELADKLLARPLLDNTQPGIKGDKIHSLIGGQLAVEQKGMRDYYDRMLPSRLQKLVSKLDPAAKVQLFGHKIYVPGEHDPEDGEYKKVHSLEITPKLRAAILKGLPAFEHGGAVVDRAFDVLSKLPR